MKIIDNGRCYGRIIVFDSNEQRDRWVTRFTKLGRFNSITCFLDVEGPALMALRIPAIGPMRHNTYVNR